MLSESERKLVRRLLGLFAVHKARLAIVCFCLVVVAAISLALPLLNKQLIDEGILAGNFRAVVIFALSILSLCFINSIIEITKEIIMANVSVGIQKNLYFKALQSLLFINASYFNTRNSAEIHNNLEIDVMRISSICDSNVIFVVTQLLTFIGGLIGLFIIDSRLSLIVILFFPIKMSIIFVLSRMKKLIYGKMLEAHNQFAHWFGDRIEGMKDVRLFGIRIHTLNEAKEKISGLTNQERKLTILDSFNVVTDSIVVKALETVLYLIGSYYIFGATLSIGSLFAFITYSVNVMNPLSVVLGINYMLAGVIPSAERYFSFLDDACVNQEVTDGEAINQIETIEFQNVTFSYGEHDVLRNASFAIKPGEHVAIVGKNGTGKTTIFNLLQRFVTPDGGEIVVNGEPISKYSIDQYRDAFACINQNNHLFDISVIENIALFKDYSPEKIAEVIELSCLQPVLDICSGSVGLNGCHLSGGQRQRVLFARVLFKDKNFLLFDEATANLDTESEKMIMGAFTTFLKKKTIISIIHSKPLLNDMDKIIELDGFGGVTVFNSYDEFTSLSADLPS